MKYLVLASNSQKSIELLSALRRLDGEMVLTDSCKQGMRLLSADPAIDLVVVRLEDRDECGRPLLRMAKKDNDAGSIPVIVAGENFSEDTIRELLTLDVDDIIVLPVTFETLEAKVNSAIRNTRKTVLVVDDDAAIREVLAQFLTMRRYCPLTAASALEALEIMKHHHVNAVISDIVMPEMTGIDLLEYVKSNKLGIPVILITGNSGEYSPRKVIEMGADGYFTKPFHYSDLSYTLVRVLNRYRDTGKPTPAEVCRS